MGRIILATTLVIFFSLNMRGIIFNTNFNFDKESLGWVTANTLAQSAINKLHNDQVDSVCRRQVRLAEMTSIMATEKLLWLSTMENVSGFKKESKYYKAMYNTGASIVKHSQDAIQAINKSNFPGKARAILEVSDLVSQAVSLGTAFADIVANSTVPNPIQHPDATNGKKDKYNILNRHERLIMANDILFRLRKIDDQISYLAWIMKNTSWKNLLASLDRESYLNAIMANIEIDDILRKWKRLKD